MQSVEYFCMELKELLKHHHFTAGAIMNYDETPVVNKDGRMVTQRAESAKKERANALLMRHSTLASLLSFVAADGSVFLSVYVMKAKIEEGQAADVNFKLHAAPRESRREWPRYFCWTETDFLNGDSVAQVVDLVATEWAVGNPSTNLLLLGDRLGAHVRPDTLLKARQVYLFFLPPKTSHFLQPIDESSLATFHNLVRRSNEQLVIEGKHVSIDTRDALLASAFTAERKTFLPHIVRESLSTTCLYPFNTDKFLARARSNLGLTTAGVSSIDQMHAAASEVIQASRERISAATGAVRTGRATVCREIAHSPAALLAQDKQRTADRLQKEREAAEKAMARVQRREEKAKKGSENAAARVGRICCLCKKKEHRRGGGVGRL